MELGYNYRLMNQSRIKQVHGGRFGSNSDSILVLKLPNWRALSVISRSVFLGLVILALPSIGSFFGEPFGFELDTQFDSLNVEFLDMLLLDLADEGLYRRGDETLIVGYDIDGVNDNLNFVRTNKIEVLTGLDSNSQSSVLNKLFDLVITFGSVDAHIVDRVVKIGGVVAVQLSNYPSNSFQEQSNYKIIYLKRFDSTILALRKTSLVDGSVNFSSGRRLCGLVSKAKKAALEGLEGVLLEPPRRALAKSNMYLKKIKYLPELLGVPLAVYQRRVFTTVGLPEDNEAVVQWFQQNYPTENQEFEVYNMEMLHEEVATSSKDEAQGIDISDWLMKNVKEDEYILMKAGAEVVEEMMTKKTICLVDELFLECKNQWQDKDKSRRAYWECLALYGRLRDEGVAVHQWWG